MAGSWDPVPWMVGGGVKHSTNIARLLAYAAFGGREGIIGSKDLQVRERAVPDGSIRVAPGACAILNRNPNVEYDAYAARLPLEDVVNITPTGSGAGRTDLVVARIKNPFLTGEPFPEPSAEDIAAGNVDFVETYIIPGMAGPTPGSHPTLAQIRTAIGAMSAIPLATLAIPASIGTIAQSYIKDWRQVANFRETTVLRIANPTGTVTLNDGTWKDLASVAVEVPEWATHFSATAVVGGAAVPGGNSAGKTRISIGTQVGEETNFNETVANADRTVLMTGDNDVAVPVAMRGTSQTFKVQGTKTGGNVNLSVDVNSSVRFDVTFHTKPEAN